jgi:hypothetical protein
VPSFLVAGGVIAGLRPLLLFSAWKEVVTAAADISDPDREDAFLIPVLLLLPARSGEPVLSEATMLDVPNFLPQGGVS